MMGRPSSIHPYCRRLLMASGLGLASLFSASGVLAQTDASPCGSLANRYGPYDYRINRDKLPIVEEYHFSAMVEAAISPMVGGDLDYTLKAFPNHHRALVSIMRLGERLKTPQPPGLQFSIECYFERALRFHADDVIVRMLYATYLQRQGREKDLLVQLGHASELAGEDAYAHYNIGLIYFDSKLYDEALAEAKRAYELGAAKPELRDQLKSLGKWKEPAEVK